MTTKLPSDHYLPLWEAAAAAEIGVHVECATENDKKLLVDALYECRRQVGGFEDLIIFQPNPANVLFIANKFTEVPLD